MSLEKILKKGSGTFGELNEILRENKGGVKPHVFMPAFTRFELTVSGVGIVIITDPKTETSIRVNVHAGRDWSNVELLSMLAPLRRERASKGL